MKFQNYWVSLKDKTELLSLRERAILAVTGVVLISVIWLQVVYTDIEVGQKEVAQQQSELNKQRVAQSERLNELVSLLAHDPNSALRQEQKSLNETLLSLRTKIEGRLSHLIAPEKMADVMKQVLSDYKGLTLLSAKNLPVEPLQLETTAAEKIGHKNLSDITRDQSEPQAVIFAHGFEMVLSGNYFQALAFLQYLESMRGFYWESLSYKVSQYPKAKITVQLNTLSLEEDWIGV